MPRPVKMLPSRRQRQPAWLIESRAALRDTVVLLREFRRPLVTFFLVFFTGGGLYHLLAANAGEPVGSLAEATFLVLSMTFLQANADFPDVWYLQAFFFLMPVIGLAVLGTGLADFAALLFNRRQRGEAWQVALADSFSGHVVVCGLGHLGLRIVSELHQLGYQVVCLERDPQAERSKAVEDLNVPLIRSDARSREAMLKAGVGRAEAIIICTNDDLLNLQIGMLARELNARIRVVMRLYDEDFGRQVRDKFDVEAVFSTSAIAAPAFAGAATQTDIAMSFALGREVLNASRLTLSARSPLLGKTIGQLEQEWDLTAVRHKRGDQIDLHPAHSISLQPGDELVVFASLNTLHQLARQNNHGRK
jgi:Trk K+ transport system NAD-binding subunit